LDYNEVITNFLNPASTSIKATADDGHFAIRDFNKSTFKTLKGAFKAADIDGSGFLSLAEMRKAAVTAGVTLGDNESNMLMKMYDESRDGKVSFDEFEKAMVRQRNANPLKCAPLPPGQQILLDGSIKPKKEPNPSVSATKFATKAFEYTYPKVVGVLRKQLGQLSRGKSQQAFDAIDRNSSGFVDKKEFSQLMRGFGIELEDEAVNDFFSHIDSDGSGELDYNEFLNHLGDVGATARDADIGNGTAAQAHVALQSVLYLRHKSLAKAFLAIDRDRDGFIDEHELRSAVDHVGVSLGKGTCAHMCTCTVLYISRLSGYLLSSSH
jgi:Ca2+-binding EF-hand superfamily protein